ncbi:MAG: hypothetical protein H6853_00610 [Rhodospirillales bacterium]|nr:hypothetical protein [Alphaproteobacteria bacterium]USO03821.1 MAG: hypothetical protein H6853_00610 [Rhodospirillales bacterium]
MSSNETKSLQNAEKIIERFGGIRPMAHKIDVPVTTVQGWKKRDVIPAGRREQILEAAQENNIDLEGVLEEDSIANENQPKEKIQGEKQTMPTQEMQPPKQHKPAASTASHVSGEEYKTRDELMAEIQKKTDKMIQTSIWSTAALLGVALIGGALLFWPSAKKIDAQGSQIASLEGEVDTLGQEVRDVNRRASFLKDLVPEDMQEKLDSLQTQARNLQENVQQLSQKADAIQETVFSEEGGSLSARLEKLEAQVVDLTGSENIGNMIERIRKLEQTVSGQEALGAAMSELGEIVSGMGGRVGTLEEKLVQAQGEDGALGKTMEGVSADELKAAAMLIAFSKLRDSLNREAPFEEDLVILQKLAGEDNQELQASLTQLAPYANGGVLTPEGLSNEFKSLAGDIVISSLKGEDVSVMDKAKARFVNVFKVEKGGEIVGGTSSQKAVARAQALLDQGDVEGAIAQLQTLDGEASETAQPFIEQAQTTLLSGQVQDMLQNMILSSLGKVSGKGAPALPSAEGLDLNNIKGTLKEVVPEGLHQEQGVIKDEESGVTVLPRQKGFKGFSAGQP